ncbi:MAG: hypothetical protein ABIR57_03880 [Aeromicrobium sp.]
MTQLYTFTGKYRLDRRFALQPFGWRMILAGVCAMVAFVLLGFNGFLDVVGWVFGALALSMFGSAVWTMARPPLVVALNAQGFRLGRMAEGDIRRGHWTDVDKVDTERGPSGTRLVFALESGQAGSIALMLLPRKATELQREVHERLNTAHGYRRIN